MKSTVESLEGLERKLNIEVPQESVQNEFELAYKNIQRQASIPGFRKGKAPDQRPIGHHSSCHGKTFPN